MQLEVGSIVEGKVTGITKFGAFIDLGEKTTGMVHISEVANAFVNDIKDFLKENDVVKVKVLSVEGGKISLSIKKAVPEQPAPKRSEGRSFRQQSSNYSWCKQQESPASFEDMMAKFKASSDEKMSDLKRNFDSKRGSSARRGPSQK